jgi:REP element-mobilizing transposase RayT
LLTLGASNILGIHVNFGTYGFWLPNDPRGSNSEYVRQSELLSYGKATKVRGRANVARAAHDRKLREEAKRRLKFPAVVLTGEQARSAAMGFGDSIRKNGYVVYACAVLPSHVHLVIKPHRYRIEQVINLMKGAATARMLLEGLHPLADCRDREGKIPSPWQQECGHEFAFTVADMWRVIRYVEEKPLKEAKRRQRWSFVTKYEP